MNELTQRIAALSKMSVGELQRAYVDAFGEGTTSRNKIYLYKKVAYRLQELAHGGLSERTKHRLRELAASAPLRHRPLPPIATNQAPLAAAPRKDRDPRLPPAGTRLTKTYKDVAYEVTVLEDGFDYRGTRFKSLSTVAKEITGTTWNGLLFFELVKRK